MDGVYTLEDLRVFGKEKTICPYYLARRMVYLLLYFIFITIFLLLIGKLSF
jgi:hypothetical protein